MLEQELRARYAKERERLEQMIEDARTIVKKVINNPEFLFWNAVWWIHRELADMYEFYEEIWRSGEPDRRMLERSIQHYSSMMSSLYSTLNELPPERAKQLHSHMRLFDNAVGRVLLGDRYDEDFSAKLLELSACSDRLFRHAADRCTDILAKAGVKDAFLGIFSSEMLKRKYWLAEIRKYRKELRELGDIDEYVARKKKAILGDISHIERKYYRAFTARGEVVPVKPLRAYQEEDSKRLDNVFAALTRGAGRFGVIELASVEPTKRSGNMVTAKTDIDIEREVERLIGHKPDIVFKPYRVREGQVLTDGHIKETPSSLAVGAVLTNLVGLPRMCLGEKSVFRAVYGDEVGPRVVFNANVFTSDCGKAWYGDLLLGRYLATILMYASRKLGKRIYVLGEMDGRNLGPRFCVWCAAEKLVDVCFEAAGRGVSLRRPLAVARGLVEKGDYERGQKIIDCVHDIIRRVAKYDGDRMICTVGGVERSVRPSEEFTTDYRFEDAHIVRCATCGYPHVCITRRQLEQRAVAVIRGDGAYLRFPLAASRGTEIKFDTRCGAVVVSSVARAYVEIPLHADRTHK